MVNAGVGAGMEAVMRRWKADFITLMALNLTDQAGF